jgi:predicted DNA-binding WGR domain protein
MIRRFEFVEGTSSKFWQIEQQGSQVITTYGRIGSSGTSSTKVEADASAAAKLVAKLIAEKTKKGYVEASGVVALAPTTSPQFAAAPDYKYVEQMVGFGEDYVPRVGDFIEDEDNYVAGTVVRVKDGMLVVRGEDGESSEVESDGYFRISKSQTIQAVWDAAMRRPQPDGVAFGDNVVPQALQESLRLGFDKLLAEGPPDFHPGSGTRVRDLVHPSLYPYVAGRSTVLSSRQGASPPSGSYDRFGRSYEASKYQWLPSQFSVSADGSTKVVSYINNLADEHEALRDELGNLFACALPLIESVVGYVNQVKFWSSEQGLEGEHELPDGTLTPLKLTPTSLRGRELQVIPKLVEYKLEPGEVHEGVWHVEGMSHEHIVATCVYVLDRDEQLEGGDLSFKRSFTLEEAGKCFWGVDQIRPEIVTEMIQSGEAPSGTLATPKGRLFVFPNSHIHKLGPLKVTGSVPGKRQVIVFWLVDPDVTILSTRNVPRQQGVIPHSEALAIRLELMEERKRHKTSFNLREVSLCEH